ncbi:MAG: response regulator [Lachnospiraceae bacterium]|nr:response regulator [Lachnospiraceae bacterium]
MDKKEQLIAQGNISDFDSFLVENRRMINEQFNKVLFCCIFAGPFIAVAVGMKVFPGVTYYTALFISLFMGTLTLLHRQMMKRSANSMFTSIIALFAIDVLLVVMDSAHLTIYITWFLVPLLALQFCDFNLYSLAVVINYGFMVFATWNMSSYFAERRLDVETPYAYFASRLGGLTIETIVMIVAGYSLSNIMSNHYKSLIEQYKNLKREKDVSERAIAASEAKSAFLSNMSHEIRTPMNAVLGMNEMILRECSDNDILAYSEGIKVAGGTLLGIINDILDFSKIEAGKLEIIPVEYDLSSVINDLVNMIQKRVDEKGLKLVLDVDSDIPKLLRGDDVRIKQVITNILTNAVKYTEKGSITFSIRYEKLEAESDSVLLKVAVKDTGIGIKKEDLEKIFTEFERVDEMRNRSIEGTGLGMSICRKLLQMMGSDLKVESMYGLGSKFYFTLKQEVVKWEEMGDYEKSYRTLISEKKKYKVSFTAPDAEVLIADDNAMNLMVFKSLLKETKVKVDMAERGEEALRMACKKKYDLLFFDHMMPEMDGIELLHELRKRGGLSMSAPAVCLTANAISGAREKYISEGFDDYLTKPIDTERLEELFRVYLPPEKIGKAEAAERTLEEPLPAELKALSDKGLLNVEKGIENSGSVKAYLSVIGTFCSSLDENMEALKKFISEKDLKNYTIRVHALKSSALIIGAAELADKALKLEEAGKRGDEGFINDNNAGFMQALSDAGEKLSEVSGAG